MTASTSVDIKRVQGRRNVRYESFGDVLADAEQLAAMPTRTLGNWSVGQIFNHLAVSTDAMLDGGPVSAPRPVQWMLRLLMKRKMTTQPLAPGWKIPATAAILIPGPTTTEQGLDQLRKATARVTQTSQRSPHPGFGVISREDWDAFHFRHCEMHMSFIVPTSSPQRK